MPSKKFSSVQDYISKLEPATAKTMQSVLNFLADEFPQLEEKIAWNVPQLHLHGRYIVGMAAFKNHLTFAPWSAVVIAKFAKRLNGLVTNKHTFQIPLGWQIDASLLRDLVGARLAEVKSENA